MVPLPPSSLLILGRGDCVQHQGTRGGVNYTACFLPALFLLCVPALTIPPSSRVSGAQVTDHHITSTPPATRTSSSVKPLRATCLPLWPVCFRECHSKVATRVAPRSLLRYCTLNKLRSYPVPQRHNYIRDGMARTPEEDNIQSGLRP